VAQEIEYGLKSLASEIEFGLKPLAWFEQAISKKQTNVVLNFI